MNVVITGAAGFLGRHTQHALIQDGHLVHPLTIESDDVAWKNAFTDVEAVVHLAGVNRVIDDAEFSRVNVGLTHRVTQYCDAFRRRPKVLFASSTKAEEQSPYGISKREGEQLLASWARATGAEAVIFRLPNLFGKWGKPDYNSVIATWCYRIARGLPCEVSDPTHTLTLLHVDDAVAALVRELVAPTRPGTARFASASPTTEVCLGRIKILLESFRDCRSTGIIPDLSDHFVARLYSTYTSYLPDDGFAYNLTRRTDLRGTLAEFIKSPAIGQIFVSRTRPGITRGDHFHHTKAEKFLVLEGHATIRFREVRTDAVVVYCVSGVDFQVLDIPPGWTHHIENIGSSELVVLFWASEIFDQASPDTFAQPVIIPATMDIVGNTAI